MRKFLDKKLLHAELPFISTTEKEVQLRRKVKQNLVATKTCLKSSTKFVSMSKYANVKTQREKLNMQLKEQEALNLSHMADSDKMATERFFEYYEKTEDLKCEIEKLKENRRLLKQIASSAEQKTSKIYDKSFQNIPNTQTICFQPH